MISLLSNHPSFKYGLIAGFMFSLNVIWLMHYSIVKILIHLLLGWCLGIIIGQSASLSYKLASLIYHCQQYPQMKRIMIDYLFESKLINLASGRTLTELMLWTPMYIKYEISNDIHTCDIQITALNQSIFTVYGMPSSFLTNYTDLIELLYENGLLIQSSFKRPWYRALSGYKCHRQNCLNLCYRRNQYCDLCHKMNLYLSGICNPCSPIHLLDSNVHQIIARYIIGS